MPCGSRGRAGFGRRRRSVLRVRGEPVRRGSRASPAFGQLWGARLRALPIPTSEPGTWAATIRAAMSGDPTRSGRLGPSDALVALGLGATLGLLFGSLSQARMYGDGPGLATMLAQGTGQAYYNIGYLPACRALAPWLSGSDPLTVPLALSAWAAALGCAAAFLLARSLGAARPAALLGTLLVAGSPLLVFFATTVEVHALQFAAVACCAAATAAAPWRRRGLALGLVALCFPFMYWTHITAVLLGPAWVLLVGIAAQRRGRAFSATGLVFGVGPLLLAVLVAAMAVGNRVSAGTWNPFEVSRFVNQIEENLRPPKAASFLSEGVLQPLYLALPFALWGLLAVVRGRSARTLDAPAAGAGAADAPSRLPLAEFAFALLLIAPSFGFYWWGGVSVRGAEFVAARAVLGWLAARGIDTGLRAKPAAAVLVCLAAIGAQGYRALAERSDYDIGFDPAQRARVVEAALKGGGLLVSATDLAPDVSIYVPNVREISLWDQLAVAYFAGHPPASVAPAARELDAFVAAGPVVFDVSYRLPTDRVIAERRRPYFEAIEAALRARFRVREIPDPYWPLLELQPLP